MIARQKKDVKHKIEDEWTWGVKSLLTYPVLRSFDDIEMQNWLGQKTE